MTLGLIWAQSRSGVIGNDGTIPWRVPEDLAHFRSITGTGAVIMGRRTWQSLPERFRPLPGRRNIVVTRQAEWRADGAVAVHSVAAALTEADGDGWIIGGGELYAATIDLADVLEVTEVDADPAGDTFAPPITDAWTTRPSDGGWCTSRTGVRYRFVTYERVSRGTAT